MHYGLMMMQEMNNRTIKDKTIYFYAVNAGAIAVMSPIVDAQPYGINCTWVVDGCDRQEFKTDENHRITLDELLNKKVRVQKNEEILILGAQHDYSKTANILKVCKASGVKTVFIFDQWGPYTSHFNFLNESMIFPEHMFAIDYHLKSKLISIGADKDRISIIGHPGIENKIKLIDSMAQNRKKEIRADMGFTSQKKILLLALELMDTNFNADKEYGMVRTLLHSLTVIKHNNLQLVVRLHPHQSRDKLLDFIRYHNLVDKLIVCPDSLKDFESIAMADIVLGMNSTFLMIPLAIGIPTISIGFDHKNTPREITIPYLSEILVNNSTELSSAISEKLSQDSCSRIAFPTGSIKNAWDSIKEFAKL
ncbi:MAG: hypothetical protein K8R67_11970 [Desulfobacteraceae bacterium]|nr:hypothetical protein [Desulfobacteraceae bacterium]